MMRPYVVENNQLISPAAIIVADTKENASPNHSRDQLLQEQPQQHRTNRGKVEVVNFEQAIQLQRLPTFHELSSTEYDKVI